MGFPKVDYPPLLAPGGHTLTLQKIEALCVTPFTGNARKCREKLFAALDDFVQQLLLQKVRCRVFTDGSFFTQKPDPDDVDVIVSIEECVMNTLNETQQNLIDAINTTTFIVGVDSLAVVCYPRDHPYFGSAVDVGNAGDAYGLEHSRLWLKGYGVLRFGETDVGLRICS